MSQDEQHTSSHWGDIPVLLALLVSVAAVFYKTVLYGIPVSRIAKLAHWDSFFYDQAQGLNMSLDPTTLLLYIPFNFLVGNIWRSGAIPLWNPLSGCGSPLIGDIESSVFSPWRLLFALSPTLKTYNLILVEQVACAAIASFLLSRSLRLSKLGSAFVALSFAFCPYVLYYSELTNGPACSLLPLLWLAFVFLARSVNIVSIVLSAFACTLFIFSTHPESAFFGIVFGSLLAILLRLFNAFGKTGSIWTELFALAKGLVATAILALGFSAPVLLPFVEYLHNAECYKFISNSSSYVSWQSIVSCLLVPACAGASPYLGVVLLPAISAGCFFRSALWRALLIFSLLIFLVVSQIGILRTVFAQGMFSSVISSYALPAMLLSLCLLAAHGIQSLQQQFQNRLLIYIALSVCMLQIIGAVIVRAHARNMAGLEFDSTLPLVVGSQSLLIMIVCTSALTLILFSKRIWQCPNAATIAVLVLAFIGTAPCLALSLPAQAPFSYQLKDPLLGIDFTNARLLSLGEHLFRPNSNWAFSIGDLRCEKSMFPKRYPEFMTACGARVDSHSQVFDKAPGRAFDVSAVPYLLTQVPIIDTSDEAIAQKTAIPLIGASKQVTDDLSLLDAQLNYLPDDSAVSADLSWQYSGQVNPPPYSMQFTISSTGSGSKLLASSDSLTLFEYPAQLNLGGYGPRPFEASSSVIHRHILVLVPTANAPGSQLHLAMQVTDLRHAPNSIPAVCSADFSTSSLSQTPVKRRFALVKETAYRTGDTFRLYRDNNAVPQAYVVHNVIASSSSDESLSLVGTSSFDPHNTAVVETRNIPAGISSGAADTSTPSLEDREDKITLQRPDTNSALINMSVSRPGFLVLADTYYPGWFAYVDGKYTDILHCNYLFKGVFIPEGKHTVEFKYLPVSFLLGILLAGLAPLFLVSWMLWRYLSKRAKDQLSEKVSKLLK